MKSNIIDELQNEFKLVKPAELERLAAAITKDRHIFLNGMGRSGLMVRAFANRLMQLGFDVSVVGEISSPHTHEGDLFLICSGSGETTSLKDQAKIAKANGVEIAVVTASPTSTLGKLADVLVVIPAQTKTSTSSQTTVQPMGALFEQTSFLLFETLVLKLMDRYAETNESMKKRHANLE